MLPSVRNKTELFFIHWSAANLGWENYGNPEKQAFLLIILPAKTFLQDLTLFPRESEAGKERPPIKCLLSNQRPLWATGDSAHWGILGASVDFAPQSSCRRCRRASHWLQAAVHQLLGTSGLSVQKQILVVGGPALATVRPHWIRAATVLSAAPTPHCSFYSPLDCFVCRDILCPWNSGAFVFCLFMAYSLC